MKIELIKTEEDVVWYKVLRDGFPIKATMSKQTALRYFHEEVKRSKESKPEVLKSVEI